MRSCSPITASTCSLFSLALCAGAAHAQTCIPEWDVSIGTNAVGSTGYLSPMTPWDDGNGEMLYIGGSAKTIGGNPINWLARWNPNTGAYTKVGLGIDQGNTNQFLTAILAHNDGGGEQLYVGGFFKGAGLVGDTKSLASWDGTAWHSLNTGFAAAPGAPSVWAMASYNDGPGDKLVVGGGFADIGSAVGANGIAMWDGTSWSGMSGGIQGTFSPTVFALETYDDGTGEKLYAGGRFDLIGGSAGPMVGAWNGTSWEPVGTLFQTGLSPQISDFIAFDDGTGTALYAGGDHIIAPGFAETEIVKWDGTSWSAVGQSPGGRVTALAVFDDGTGPALYQSGTAQPNVNYIARLENNVWVPVLGGVNVNGGSTSGNFPSVFGMTVWNDSLYAAGNFMEIGGLQTRGFAKYDGCATCYADCDGSGALNILDYICFGDDFAAGGSYADCDGNGSLNILDYICFGDAFAAGCP